MYVHAYFGSFLYLLMSISGSALPPFGNDFFSLSVRRGKYCSCFSLGLQSEPCKSCRRHLCSVTKFSHCCLPGIQESLQRCCGQNREFVRAKITTQDDLGVGVGTVFPARNVPLSLAPFCAAACPSPLSPHQSGWPYRGVPFFTVSRPSMSSPANIINSDGWETSCETNRSIQVSLDLQSLKVDPMAPADKKRHKTYPIMALASG